MKASIGRAAVFAALFLPAVALAQDVTLIARDGGLTLSGTLQGYDGEFYRIETAYGPLTVDGEGVICEGPACPDLTAPRAAIRFVGIPDAGAALIPPLLQAFAAARGYEYRREAGAAYAAQLVDRETAQVLADVSFAPAAP
jgi:phosphate transport system substrate-binding protein